MLRTSFALAATLAMIACAQAQTYRDSSGAILQGVVPIAGCPVGGGQCTGGSISGGGGGGSSTQPIGAASLATSQASIPTTAGGTQIVAARTGASGTGRVAVTICNTGATAVYVGNSGLTATNGTYVGPNGACLTLNTTAAVFGITASGTDAVTAAETF